MQDLTTNKHTVIVKEDNHSQNLSEIDTQAYWDTASQDMAHLKGLFKPDGDYLEYLFC